jgi:hypothetical protein
MPFRPLPYAIGILALVALQVAVLNQVSLWGLARPFPYPLLILALPFGFSRAGSLGLAFAAGLLLDVFSDTPGLHAAALVAMAYGRKPVAGLITPKGGYEAGDAPHIASLGAVWYLAYAGMLLLLHHAILFGLEAFTLAGLGRTLARVLLSTALSLATVLLLEFLFGPRSDRRR